MSPFSWLIRLSFYWPWCFDCLPLIWKNFPVGKNLKIQEKNVKNSCEHTYVAKYFIKVHILVPSECTRANFLMSLLHTLISSHFFFFWLIIVGEGGEVTAAMGGLFRGKIQQDLMSDQSLQQWVDYLEEKYSKTRSFTTAMYGLFRWKIQQDLISHSSNGWTI